MTVRELLQYARNTLGDQEKSRWDDPELLSYYQEARRVLASERKEKKTTQTIPLDALRSTYSPTNVLRYISAVDNEGNTRSLYPDDGSGDDDNLGIVVIDYNEIFVNDPTIGTDIYMSHISFPETQNMNQTVRQGDENAIKYYILSKAYEKETDMENFNKANIFESKFEDSLTKLMATASVGYNNERVRTIKGYYF